MKANTRLYTKSFLTVATLIAVIAVFQNCSPSALPDDASTSTSLSSAASATSSLKVTYAPSTPNFGTAVTIAATGGTAPYSYAMVGGTGKLLGNVYTTGAAAETATIMVADSGGDSTTITIISSAAGSTTTTVTTATATPTPVPTPVVVPPTSIAGTALPSGTYVARSCNLVTLAAAGAAAGSNMNAAVPAAINYMTCIVLGRAPTSTELAALSQSISNCSAGPFNIMIEEFMSAEAQTKYLYSSDNATNWVTTLYRTHMFRDPSASELATYGAMFTRMGQSATYESFLEGPFMSSQSYIAQVTNEWDEWYDAECN